MKKNIIQSLCYAPRYSVMKIIKIYQHTISFDHGILRGMYPNGYCKFYPSCSQYGYEAVERYGVIGGGIKTLWRVVRCNPWNSGGVDVV